MNRALVLALVLAAAVGVHRWKRAHRPRLPRVSAHIVLYSVQGCGACNTMRGWLDKRQLPYRNRDAQALTNEDLIVLSRRSPIHEFPLLEVNDHFYGIHQAGDAEDALDQFE